jgi:dienelactone hydrolase
LTLKGTLALPDGKGPFPAVLFGAGSGPVGRDERVDGQLNTSFGCEIAIFRELSEALARRGYASLRYDKRACGPFNECANNGYVAPGKDMTVDVELDDARAAFTTLAERPEVDPSRLFYVGHSQGAAFAPRLMRDDPSPKAAVLLAGPHSPIDQLLAVQLDETRQLLDRAGASQGEIDKAIAPLSATVANLTALRAGGFKGDAIQGTGVAYWQSWLDFDDATPAMAMTTPQPILFLSGDYDFNVPPSELMAWRQEIQNADASDHHETVLLPCVTHAMNCITEPDPLKVTPADVGCSVSSDVVHTVMDFLDRE